jgi:uridine phosphorylase
MELKESELILQKDGSIYHLNLKPEDIGSIIITVGDPARVHSVSKHFDSIELKKSYREFTTHTGYLKNKRISVISTGIGPDNIDIVINELDALVNIDLNTRNVKEQLQKLKIIRIGTSGSIQPDVPVDSFLKSKLALGLDNLMAFYPEFDHFSAVILESLGQISWMDQVHPYLTSSSERLFNSMGKDFFSGITITSPGFYGPQGRSLRLGTIFNKLIKELTAWEYEELRLTNFEMETSAIYGLSGMLGHEAISMNAIIANRVHKNFSSDISGQIEKLIKLVLADIEQSDI